MLEFRADFHRLDARPLRRDARGFVVVSSWATRCGVFEYTRGDGSKVRELRHPDDVFEAAHLESLRGASVTIGHPTVHVSPSNVRELEVGVVAGARQDGRFVAADLSIREASAIAKVERGDLVELSCGYTLDVDPTPGVFDGERFDQRQKNLRVNHVALGPSGWGRAGREVRLRMDSAGVPIAAAITFIEPGAESMTSRSDASQRLEEVRADVKKRVQAVQDKISPPKGTFEERLAAAEERLRNGGAK